MPKQRNLLVIMSDEHQARAMGCAGHPFVQTPHLDALAAKGRRFANAYTPSPICVPARAAFATGNYVHKTRHWDNAMPYTGAPKGWGHALQSAGVRVESIGKLHYRDTEDDVGFDAEHMPLMVQDGLGMVWASIRHEDERWAPETRMLGPDIGVGESRYTEYDRAIVARTSEWFQTAGDQPWCLFVGLVAPHFPLICPKTFYDLYAGEDVSETKLDPNKGYLRHPWIEKQNAYMDSDTAFADEAERQRAVRAYYGLCSWVDHSVGQIVAALEAAGLSQTTDIVYTSDHGDNAGARRLWGKSNMYEESVAVPMICAIEGWEGVEEKPVSLLDLSKTIAHHFGTQIEGPGAPLDQIPENRPVFSEYHAAGAVSGAYMLRRGPWKLIHYEGFEPELFHLDEDPEETKNRASEPICASLMQELRALCDPVATDTQAHADQRALVDRLGGPEAVRQLGPHGASPPPEV